MFNNDPKSGTPEPDDTDAGGSPTGGTSVEDDRDAGDEKDADATPLHLQWKEKAERTNAAEERSKALEEENAALKSQLEGRVHQPADDVVPNDIERAQSDIEELEEENLELYQQAKAGSISARNQIRLNQQLISLRTDTINALTLMRVPDHQKAAVIKTWEQDQRSRNKRFKNIAEVAAAYKQLELQKENEALKKKLAELETPPPKNGKQPRSTKSEDVPRTAGAGSPPTSKSDRPVYMAKDAFTNEVNSLLAAFEDGSDPQGQKKAHQMQQKLRSGMITFQQG